jgi:small conductance mechanosensitive channel
MRFFRHAGLWAALALLLAGPVSAQTAPEPVAAAPSTIASRAGETDDADIAGRIRSIFTEVAGLSAVKVEVSAGVVTLEGAVASGADADRAGAIAERVAGVVTVQNNLERSLGVQSNVAPALGKFQKDLKGLIDALPLLAVAMGIGLAIALLGHWLAGRRFIWVWITPNGFLAELVASLVRAVFFIVGAVVALQILGATALLGAVLGGAGVIGIAIGFAVRDTVDNYVSSLMLSLRQPFRANDHIVVEGQEGRVVRLTSRATVLMTLDGNHLRIPNAIVFKSVILNYTRNPERRFEFELGVDGEDDPLAAIKVGLAAMSGLDFVLDNPGPSAVIQNVGDSNIVLRFYGWVDQEHTDFLKGRSQAIAATKTALETADFSLPEPIYRLRFDSQPPGGEAPVRKPAPARPAPAESHDTAPTPYVERRVREERTDEDDGDLLDERTPIE